MKLIDILIDKFRDTTLFEMAYSRERAWKKISGVSYELTYHLVKILTMPESRDQFHWKKEVNTFISSIDDIYLKPKNKRLHQRYYWEWLVAEPEYRIDKMVSRIQQDYKGQKIIIPHNLQQDIQHILLRITKDLGEDKFVSIEQYL